MYSIDWVFLYCIISPLVLNPDKYYVNILKLHYVNIVQLKNYIDSLVNVSLAYIVNTHNVFNNYQESCAKCGLAKCLPISSVCLCVDCTVAPPYHFR